MINGFILNNGFYSKEIELNIQPFIHIIFKDLGLNPFTSNELKSCILELTKESIFFKEIAHYDESDIALINKISELLSEPFTSIIDYLIFKKDHITYESFFSINFRRRKNIFIFRKNDSSA